MNGDYIGDYKTEIYSRMALTEDGEEIRVALRDAYESAALSDAIGRVSAYNDSSDTDKYGVYTNLIRLPEYTIAVSRKNIWDRLAVAMSYNDLVETLKIAREHNLASTSLFKAKNERKNILHSLETAVKMNYSREKVYTYIDQAQSIGLDTETPKQLEYSNAKSRFDVLDELNRVSSENDLAVVKAAIDSANINGVPRDTPGYMEATARRDSLMAANAAAAFYVISATGGSGDSNTGKYIKQAEPVGGRAAYLKESGDWEIFCHDTHGWQFINNSKIRSRFQLVHGDGPTSEYDNASSFVNGTKSLLSVNGYTALHVAEYNEWIKLAPRVIEDDSAFDVSLKMTTVGDLQEAVSEIDRDLSTIQTIDASRAAYYRLTDIHDYTETVRRRNLMHTRSVLLSDLTDAGFDYGKLFAATTNAGTAGMAEENPQPHEYMLAYARYRALVDLHETTEKVSVTIDELTQDIRAADELGMDNTIQYAAAVAKKDQLEREEIQSARDNLATAMGGGNIPALVAAIDVARTLRMDTDDVDDAVAELNLLKAPFIDRIDAFDTDSTLIGPINTHLTEFNTVLASVARSVERSVERTDNAPSDAELMSIRETITALDALDPSLDTLWLQVITLKDELIENGMISELGDLEIKGWYQPLSRGYQNTRRMRQVIDRITGGSSKDKTSTLYVNEAISGMMQIPTGMGAYENKIFNGTLVDNNDGPEVCLWSGLYDDGGNPRVNITRSPLSDAAEVNAKLAAFDPMSLMGGGGGGPPPLIFPEELRFEGPKIQSIDGTAIQSEDGSLYQTISRQHEAYSIPNYDFTYKFQNESGQTIYKSHYMARDEEHHTIVHDIEYNGATYMHRMNSDISQFEKTFYFKCAGDIGAANILYTGYSMVSNPSEPDCIRMLCTHTGSSTEYCFLTFLKTNNVVDFGTLEYNDQSNEYEYNITGLGVVIKAIRGEFVTLTDALFFYPTSKYTKILYNADAGIYHIFVCASSDGGGNDPASYKVYQGDSTAGDIKFTELTEDDVYGFLMKVRDEGITNMQTSQSSFEDLYQNGVDVIADLYWMISNNGIYKYDATNDTLELKFANLGTPWPEGTLHTSIKGPNTYQIVGLNMNIESDDRGCKARVGSVNKTIVLDDDGAPKLYLDYSAVPNDKHYFSFYVFSDAAVINQSIQDAFDDAMRKNVLFEFIEKLNNKDDSLNPFFASAPAEPVLDSVVEPVLTSGPVAINFADFAIDSNPTSTQEAHVYKHEYILIVDNLSNFVLNNSGVSDKHTVVLISENDKELTYDGSVAPTDGVIYTICKTSNITLKWFPSEYREYTLTNDVFNRHIKPRFHNEMMGYNPAWIETFGGGTEDVDEAVGVATEAARIEAERVVAEAVEAERVWLAEEAKIEAERVAVAEAARIEAERVAAEEAERARLEVERRRLGGSLDRHESTMTEMNLVQVQLFRQFNAISKKEAEMAADQSLTPSQVQAVLVQAHGFESTMGGHLGEMNTLYHELLATNSEIVSTVGSTDGMVTRAGGLCATLNQRKLSVGTKLTDVYGTLNRLNEINRKAELRQELKSVEAIFTEHESKRKTLKQKQRRQGLLTKEDELKNTINLAPETVQIEINAIRDLRAEYTTLSTEVTESIGDTDASRTEIQRVLGDDAVAPLNGSIESISASIAQDIAAMDELEPRLLKLKEGRERRIKLQAAKSAVKVEEKVQQRKVAVQEIMDAEHVAPGEPIELDASDFVSTFGNIRKKLYAIAPKNVADEVEITEEPKPKPVPANARVYVPLHEDGHYLEWTREGDEIKRRAACYEYGGELRYSLTLYDIRVDRYNYTERDVAIDKKPGDIVHYESGKRYYTIRFGGAEEAEDDDDPYANVCFPAGTCVDTDQGQIPIQDLTDHNTIRGKGVVDVSRTRMRGNRIIRIKRHALGHNVPAMDTQISPEHRIRIDGHLVQAKNLVGEFYGVKFVPYHGEPLYNVLMDDYSTMVVHGMTVETLDPNSEIAKLYTVKCKFDRDMRDRIVGILKECAETGNYAAYRQVIGKC
jgi:hypothetical protein